MPFRHVEVFTNGRDYNQGRRSLRGKGAFAPQVFSGFHSFYPKKCVLRGQFQTFAPLVFQNSRCRPLSFLKLPTPLSIHVLIQNISIVRHDLIISISNNKPVKLVQNKIELTFGDVKEMGHHLSFISSIIALLGPRWNRSKFTLY